jgi:hypothetical protein
MMTILLFLLIVSSVIVTICLTIVFYDTSIRRVITHIDFIYVATISFSIATFIVMVIANGAVRDFTRQHYNTYVGSLDTLGVITDIVQTGENLAYFDISFDYPYPNVTDSCGMVLDTSLDRTMLYAINVDLETSVCELGHYTEDLHPPQYVGLFVFFAVLPYVWTGMLMGGKWVYATFLIGNIIDNKLATFAFQTTSGDCSICTNTSGNKDFVKLGCGHIFHTKCMQKWLVSPDSNKLCPLCRVGIV